MKRLYCLLPLLFVMSASAYEEFWLEPENGVIQSTMIVANDNQASEGRYVMVPEGVAGLGKVELYFDVGAGSAVPTSDEYVVWLRHKSPGGGSNSVYAYIDGVEKITWHLPVTVQWSWHKLNRSFSLRNGRHQLRLRNREDGTMIDKVFITNGDTVPTHQGPVADNSAHIWIEVEDDERVARVGDFANLISDNTASQGQCALVGAVGGHATFNFDVPKTGLYKISVRTRSPSQSANSFWLNLDGQGEVKWHIDINDDWHWSSPPLGNSGLVQLTEGSHSLRIRKREAGTGLDKLMITPQTGLDLDPADGITMKAQVFDPETWAPPRTQDNLQSGIIQDFSYAGYDGHDSPFNTVITLQDGDTPAILIDGHSGEYQVGFDNMGPGPAIDNRNYNSGPLINRMLEIAGDLAAIDNNVLVSLPSGDFFVDPISHTENEAIRIRRSFVHLTGEGMDKTRIIQIKKRLDHATVDHDNMDPNDTLRSRAVIAVAPFNNRDCRPDDTKGSKFLQTNTLIGAMDLSNGVELGQRYVPEADGQWQDLWVIIRQGTLDHDDPERLVIGDNSGNRDTPASGISEGVAFLRRIDEHDYLNAPIRWAFDGSTPDDGIKPQIGPPCMQPLEEFSIRNLAIGVEAMDNFFNNYPAFRKEKDGNRIYYTEMGLTVTCDDGLKFHCWNTEGNTAYYLHNSYAIRTRFAVNGIIENISSLETRPATSSLPPVHLSSGGIELSNSAFITVRNVDLQHPQYKGYTGNGYLFRLLGQENLIEQSSAKAGRHNYSFINRISSGNVLLDSQSIDAELPLDFHQHMSVSNLIDNMTLNNDYISAIFREVGTHGNTTSQSVIWNTISRNRNELDSCTRNGHSYCIVHTGQYGPGYVLGTYREDDTNPNSLSFVRRNSIDGDDDVIDSVGMPMYPQSLYRWQREKRLGN